MEVWAFFPNEPVPLCLFSKLDEKRFPSTEEIISRIVDNLNVLLPFLCVHLPWHVGCFSLCMWGAFVCLVA